MSMQQAFVDERTYIRKCHLSFSPSPSLPLPHSFFFMCATQSRFIACVIEREVVELSRRTGFGDGQRQRMRNDSRFFKCFSVSVGIPSWRESGGVCGHIPGKHVSTRIEFL